MEQKELTQQIKFQLNNLQEACRKGIDIAKTASRHSKPLAGQNFYSKKFHEVVLKISKAESVLKSSLSAHLETDEIAKFADFVSNQKSTSLNRKQRDESLKELQIFCETIIIPKLEATTVNPIPSTEQVLPLSVVKPTRRTYIERIVIQANGCYERGWYDACAVMMRRLTETLIIELFESKGKSENIKKDGNFLMLSGLVDKVLAEKSWNLQRDTQKVLPELKTLGDRSAHARHYLCTKPDIDKVLSGFRMAVDNLLHLANLK